MAVIDELGIEVLWRVSEIEIRYPKGEEPLEWTQEKEIQILKALGLKPWAWRLGSGRLVRASDGTLVEVVELSRRTEA